MTEEEQTEMLEALAEEQAIVPKDSAIFNKILTGNITVDDISDEVYKSYIRSVLGGTPFKMSFSLFDNAVQIEYSEVSTENCDKYNKLVSKYSYSPYLLQKLAALAYIYSIKLQDKVPYKENFNIPDSWMSDTITEQEFTKEVETAYAKAFGFLNESINRVLPLFWSGFNQILKLLVIKGAPTSF